MVRTRFLYFRAGLPGRLIGGCTSETQLTALPYRFGCGVFSTCETRHYFPQSKPVLLAPGAFGLHERNGYVSRFRLWRFFRMRNVSSGIYPAKKAPTVSGRRSYTLIIIKLSFNISAAIHDAYNADGCAGFIRQIKNQVVIHRKNSKTLTVPGFFFI